jgi:hypothetical protein
MNLLTQLTLGEMLEFLDAFNGNMLLIPSWGAPLPSEEDQNRVSLFRVNRGTVRTLRNVLVRALATPLQGHRYTRDTLVDVRNGPSEGSMTLGVLIASVRPWNSLGET